MANRGRVADRKVDWKQSFQPVRSQAEPGNELNLRFRYRMTGASSLRVELANHKSGWSSSRSLIDLNIGSWTETVMRFDAAADETGKLRSADELRFFADDAKELLIDDVLLYEPSDASD